MRVSEVMTREVVCCSRTTSVMTAARMLRESDVGILPVIDELDRKLMGVVTDRDLCLAALRELHDPSLTTVEDCMTTDLVTCRPDTDIREALAAMMKRQVRRVPVIDRDNAVRGIIGISDVIRHNAVGPRDVCMVLSRIMAPKHLGAEAA